MRLNIILIFLTIFCWPSLSLAERSSTAPTHFRGWDHLVEKLLKENISRLEIEKVYLNPKMPPFTSVPFSLNPKETNELYSKSLSPHRIKLAKRHLQSHKAEFEKAEKKFGVDKYTIAAILLIESQFGKATGNALVVNRLSRLANIAAPDNIDFNFKRLTKDDPTVLLEQVQKRAEYLENTFYPEVPAAFIIARKNRINVLEIKGSYAGAFGIPQFLPSSYLQFGVDGDNDGKISLYSMPDAIASTANFLGNFGWNSDLKEPEKQSILWHYNRSKPYSEAVISLADKLKEQEK